MMILIKIFVFHFIVFVLLFQCIYSFDSNDPGPLRRLRLEPNTEYHMINSTVKLICEAINDNNKMTNVFLHDRVMVGEKCVVYSEDFQIECEQLKEDNFNITIYTFILKKLKWKDRGKWTCKVAQMSKVVNIKVKVPPIVQQFLIVLKKHKRTTASIKDSSSVARVIENNNQLENEDVFRRGRGSRTNPVNLRDKSVLNITCKTSCSYPPVQHVWIYGNATEKPYIIKSNKTRFTNCTDYPGMQSGESFLLVNCSTLKMVGANQITCLAGNSKNNYFVLCEGGNKPWSLTHGEIGGLGLSVLLVIVLIIILTILSRAQSNNISKIPHTRLETTTMTSPHGLLSSYPIKPPIMSVAASGSFIGGPTADSTVNSGVRV